MGSNGMSNAVISCQRVDVSKGQEFRLFKYCPRSNIFYIKTLRAQLSSHEQLLLFYSVISEIGRSWLEPVNYISKYRLIKNLPLEKGFTYNVNPADYFNIKYEDGASPYRTRM